MDTLVSSGYSCTVGSKASLNPKAESFGVTLLKLQMFAIDMMVLMLEGAHTSDTLEVAETSCASEPTEAQVVEFFLLGFISTNHVGKGEKKQSTFSPFFYLHTEYPFFFEVYDLKWMLLLISLLFFLNKSLFHSQPKYFTFHK